MRARRAVNVTHRPHATVATSAPLGRFLSTMRSSEAMRTVNYRGHRIRTVRLGQTWHAVVHGPTGAISQVIEGVTLVDAMARAEWVVETQLAFRPPSAGERRAG